MFNNVHQQDYTIKWSNLTTKQNQLKLQKEGTITITLITHAEKKIETDREPCKCILGL